MTKLLISVSTILLIVSQCIGMEFVSVNTGMGRLKELLEQHDELTDAIIPLCTPYLGCAGNLTCTRLRTYKINLEWGFTNNQNTDLIATLSQALQLFVKYNTPLQELYLEVPSQKNDVIKLVHLFNMVTKLQLMCCRLKGPNLALSPEDYNKSLKELFQAISLLQLESLHLQYFYQPNILFLLPYLKSLKTLSNLNLSYSNLCYYLGKNEQTSLFSWFAVLPNLAELNLSGNNLHETGDNCRRLLAESLLCNPERSITLIIDKKDDPENFLEKLAGNETGWEELRNGKPVLQVKKI